MYDKMETARKGASKKPCALCFGARGWPSQRDRPLVWELARVEVRERALHMSAIRPIADSNRTLPKVRKVPEADILDFARYERVPDGVLYAEPAVAKHFGRKAT
jgi:hypothetical protein